MDLSIIIVNYKNLDMLRLCLKSILNSDLNNKEYEILLIDSEAEKETEEAIADEFPNVKYLGSRENTGYAKAVNWGIRESSGEKIFVLNPDTVVKKDSIKKLIDYMDSNPSAGLVGPRLLNFDGTPQQSAFRFYKIPTILCRRTPLGRTGYGKKILEEFMLKNMDLGKPAEVDWLSGAAIMASRSAIEKIGPMDERFFIYFEDVDWARRFLQQGYKVIYYPLSEIFHYHQRESKSKWGVLDPLFNKKTRWHLTSAAKYFLKYK